MKTMAWPMEPEEVMRVLRAIQFDYCKWDIFHRGDTSILPDALVLSAHEHQMLVEAAEQVWSALMELEEAVCSDPELLEAVGVPRGLREATLDQREDNPRVTRCDFHLTDKGRWLISEFNNDTPTGFGEAVGVAEVLSSQWSDRFEGLSFEGGLREALVDSLANWSSVGLIHATGYSEDLQHVTLVAEWLEEAGASTVIGSPANLQVESSQARVFDTPVEALFRYYPGEWLVELPNAHDWTQAAAFLPMMNPLSAVASQSKRFYASCREHDIALSDDAKAALDTYLPASNYLSSLSKNEVLSNPKRWVLKGAFGRMGDMVRIGPLMSKKKWTEAVEKAFDKPREMVAQRRFEIAPVWTTRGLGYATVGVYLVDGKFAGYYSRIDRGPLIDYDSWHVPTLVEIP